MDKWEMYMEIKQLLRQGFSKVKIAQKLGVSRTTVYRYIDRNPQSMAVWVEYSKKRQKKLDPYKDMILTWLRTHPDMSAAQVMDWLLERYDSLIVSESTVRNYVRELRETYDIPKESNPRSYEALPEKPMGQQMQVDFGQTEQVTASGKKEKLRFIAFVLAHSRQKYMEWLDRPFNTRDVIRCHENAFHFYGGMPNELVYDQDALILVSENHGDLILTREFQSYKEERQLNLHICRKADPESKGKIENVIKYIKQNFAKHRMYHSLDKWNEESLKWLERTGNYKQHHTTKKRPAEVFALEKQHLRPVSIPIEGYLDSTTSSITRSVRKDNTIWFDSNRYSVPLGTFNKIKEVYIKVTDETLTVIEPDTGDILAQHMVDSGKGNLIQDTNHLRNRTHGIEAYIMKVAQLFTDTKKAKCYLQDIRKHRSRYIRDQLQLIEKHLNKYGQVAIDAALNVCVENNLHSATEFIDVIQYANRQSEDTFTNEEKPIQPLHPWSDSILETTVYKRDIDEYVSVLEGDRS